MRLSSANAYDNALQNIYTKQSEMAGQQEKLTSGKNVNRVSDDPTGAAQSERAMTRLARIASDQRSLEAQRSALTLAESTLGDAASVVQRLRELTITAGNGAYNASDRSNIANEMTGLRNQLFAMANSRDSNGTPLFGGQGSSSEPFSDGIGGVSFNGVAGQQSGTEVSVPAAMDGQAVWMNVRSGNGTFGVTSNAGNTGSLWTDTGQVLSPAALTGHDYSVSFTVAPGVGGAITYSVQDNTTANASLPKDQPYVPGKAITFDGLSLVANGKPANGDTVQINPSTTTNMFKVIDDAIAAIGNSTSTSSQRSQATGLALTQIDAGLNQLQAARSQAGQWLNRADAIQSAQEGRTVQLEAAKSRAEDLDMVKGISDFTRLQNGYQAALQSYAQVQKLSLFNFIN